MAPAESASRRLGVTSTFGSVRDGVVRIAGAPPRTERSTVMRRASGTVAGIVIGLMMAAMTVVAVVLTGGLSLRNPFRTETTYHDQSALLVKLRNVSRYEA